MTKEEKLETAGLKPLGVRRLQELRRENEELRTMVEDQAGRIKALQRALEKVQERECRGIVDRPPSAGEEPMISHAGRFPEPGPEVDLEPGPAPDPVTGSEMESVPDLEPGPEAEPAPKPEPGPEPEFEMESVPDLEPGPEADLEPGPEPDPVTGSEPDPAPDPAPDLTPQFVPVSVPGPEAEAESSGPGEAPSAPRGGKRVSRETEAVHRRIVEVLGNMSFYIAIVLALTGAVFIRAARGGTPFSIVGYSGMLVLSESMQDAIPKGSFILTKSVEPTALEPGDDITYMVNSTTSVTHRIMDIRPQPDGTLAFQTQGVNNTGPDSTLVPEDHVVGKVIYHSLLLGLVAQGISDNWPLLLFLLGVWTALGWTLSQILGENRYQGKRLVCEPAQNRHGGTPLVAAIKRRKENV